MHTAGRHRPPPPPKLCSLTPRPSRPGRFESPTEVVTYELTNDHTPCLMHEANRVLAAGVSTSPRHIPQTTIRPARHTYLTFCRTPCHPITVCHLLRQRLALPTNTRSLIAAV